MKALVYTGPESLEFRDEPEPIASDNEVLINIEAVGICGSDMHAYLGHDDRRPPPLILGHEASGRALTGRYEGQRVVINPLVSCGLCDACLGGRANICGARQIISMAPRPGAFAERVAVPESNILPVPDGMAPETAALAEPIATGYHAVVTAVRALSRPLAECRTLVIGGGAVGLSAALVAAAQGAQNICLAETISIRRQSVEASTGFDVIDPISDKIEKNGFDLVIDAVGGAATRKAASQAIRPGGVIIHIGLMDAEPGLDIRKLTLQEVTFIGVYTYTMVDFRATLEAMHNGLLGGLDWHQDRALSEGADAFAELLAGRVTKSKVILCP
jgi:2-desacetyl-2-hydroxyethyl bacteriochlorophyllide A dehydrogenase